MPLILISGLPSSGKTKRSNELKEYFEKNGRKVYLISENVAIKRAGFRKNEYFGSSQLEKQVRSDMKSEILRLLNKDDIVIFDAGNYIKGFRYEIYCANKSSRSTQLTLFTAIQNEKAWNFNCKRTEEDPISSAALDNSQVPYTKEIFDALCDRFEEPHGNNRWDSPLFVVFPEDDLDFDKINSALFESKPLQPNQSTQNPPLSSANYLFDLDRITQSIINDILAAQKIGITGNFKVKDSTIDVECAGPVSPAQLNRLRRQFINYSKLHTANVTINQVPQLFAQYLNTNLKE